MRDPILTNVLAIYPPGGDTESILDAITESFDELASRPRSGGARPHPHRRDRRVPAGDRQRHEPGPHHRPARTATRTGRTDQRVADRTRRRQRGPSEGNRRGSGSHRKNDRCSTGSRERARERPCATRGPADQAGQAAGRRRHDAGQRTARASRPASRAFPWCRHASASTSRWKDLHASVLDDIVSSTILAGTETRSQLEIAEQMKHIGGEIWATARRREPVRLRHHARNGAAARTSTCSPTCCKTPRIQPTRWTWPRRRSSRASRSCTASPRPKRNTPWANAFSPAIHTDGRCRRPTSLRRSTRAAVPQVPPRHGQAERRRDGPRRGPAAGEDGRGRTKGARRLDGFAQAVQDAQARRCGPRPDPNRQSARRGANQHALRRPRRGPGPRRLPRACRGHDDPGRRLHLAAQPQPARGQGLHLRRLRRGGSQPGGVADHHRRRRADGGHRAGTGRDALRDGSHGHLARERRRARRRQAIPGRQHGAVGRNPGGPREVPDVAGDRGPRRVVPARAAPGGGQTDRRTTSPASPPSTSRRRCWRRCWWATPSRSPTAVGRHRCRSRLSADQRRPRAAPARRRLELQRRAATSPRCARSCPTTSRCAVRGRAVSVDGHRAPARRHRRRRPPARRRGARHRRHPLRRAWRCVARRTLLTVLDCGLASTAPSLRRQLLPAACGCGGRCAASARVVAISEFTADAGRRSSPECPATASTSFRSRSTTTFVPRPRPRPSPTTRWCCASATTPNKNLRRVDRRAARASTCGSRSLGEVGPCPAWRRSTRTASITRRSVGVPAAGCGSATPTPTSCLFPSTYEGFGMPIVEAQATGRPVVTSDRAPMNEVGGGRGVPRRPGGRGVDPRRRRARARATRRTAPNWCAAGFVNRERFRPEVAARRLTREIYREMTWRRLGSVAAVDALGEARLATGGGVRVDDALGRRLVELLLRSLKASAASSVPAAADGGLGAGLQLGADSLVGDDAPSRW